MILHLVNPNGTASMTDRAAAAAKAVISPGTTLLACNPRGTPASIEGYADEAMAVPALLRAIMSAEAQGAAAHVIACFDDPGLDAAREVARGPVIGICQAAVQVAMTIAARFSVVTTLPRSVPIIEDLLQSYGATHRCRSVRAADMPVLDLEEGGTALIEAQILAARDEDRVDAVILGCAGMADLAADLRARCGIPVIDGVTAAVKFAEAMVGGGFATSKCGAYALPRAKAGSVLEADPGG
ncbi:MAG: aspartate/glutamate racemase family protein [Paracoccus sp. (in: a-proteobacteria)]|uniref:aspartate/glutamate racemase family protein n=1 Tax=Paracoccus sp. TaxID=267 RepID=UPI0026DEEE98|nr:aspartate/glutamate racemase family protein [Paracoccus sp. (in: a-proteobacteria)]MDO5611943.1 aspartate/glutamate racemase family protein [Paracoccus sp. (in: a-proteobacteria)]